MAEVSKTIRQACQYLRHMVRFRTASIRYPGADMFPGEHENKLFRESVRLYVESWITPTLDAMETGDTDAIRHTLECLGHREKIGTEYGYLRPDEIRELEDKVLPFRWSNATPTKPGLYLIKPAAGSTPEFDVGRVNIATGEVYMIHWFANLKLHALADGKNLWFGPIPEPPKS